MGNWPLTFGGRNLTLEKTVYLISSILTAFMALLPESSVNISFIINCFIIAHHQIDKFIEFNNTITIIIHCAMILLLTLTINFSIKSSKLHGESKITESGLGHGKNWSKCQLVINKISFSLIYQMLKLGVSWILTQWPEDSSKLFRCDVSI